MEQTSEDLTQISADQVLASMIEPGHQLIATVGNGTLRVVFGTTGRSVIPEVEDAPSVKPDLANGVKADAKPSKLDMHRGRWTE